MRPLRRTALLALLGAGVLAVIGGALVRHALSLPAPDRTRPPEHPGTVTEILTVSCGPRNRPSTCLRPVVSYTVKWAVRKVVSRSAYRPASPHAQGTAVGVLVEPDGTEWIASEWETRLAERERAYASARSLPLWMGLLTLACAVFALVLSVAIARAAPAAPQEG